VGYSIREWPDGAHLRHFGAFLALFLAVVFKVKGSCALNFSNRMH